MTENIYETLPEHVTPEKTDPSDQYVEMSTPTSKQAPIVDLDLSPLSPEITIEKITHEDCQLNVTLSDSDALDNSYEIVEHEEDKEKSHLSSLEKKAAEDTTKSVKDRMFLSTDDAAATLLFTQTVTSPMLTPSEENIDFLKGFQREVPTSDSPTSNGTPPDSNKNSSSESTDRIEPAVNENIYENAHIFLKKNSENIYENLKDCKNNIAVYGNFEECKNDKEDDEHEEHIYQDIEDCKKEGVYEEVSDIKTITSQMISDEIMVDNILYNNVDELKMRQIEEMVTDLDATEENVDSDKIYEPITTKDDEINIYSSENYDSIVKTSETTSKIIKTTTVNYTESVETNHSDFIESNSAVTENHAVIKESLKNGFESNNVSDENAQGDGSKVLNDNEKSPQNYSTCNGNEKNKESYSEFIHHSKTESNYYEKYTKVVSNSKSPEICNREKDTESVPAEIVKTLKSQFSKPTSEVSTPTRKEVEDVNELRAINIMKQINKFENKDFIHPEDVSIVG